MLRILNAEQLDKCLPDSYAVMPALEDDAEEGDLFANSFYPGQLADIYRFEVNGEIEDVICGPCTIHTVGIIDDIRDPDIGDDSTLGGQITVWNIPGMICETDMVNDDGELYVHGADLYPCETSNLSTRKEFSFMRPVAKVISYNDGILKFRWLGA